MLKNLILTLGLASLGVSQTLAPGGPGRDAQWATAAKQAVGTSASETSKVWFTLAEGSLTEVYYPDVTMANVQTLEFVVVNSESGAVETESESDLHQIKSLGMRRDEKLVNLPSVTSIGSVQLSEIYRYLLFPNSLVFTQINRGKKLDWTISKSYFTDPATNTVLISVGFATSDKNNELYIYYDPSLANSGMGDSAWTSGRALVSKDGGVASALVCGRCRMSEATNGFLGVNDGLTQLRRSGRIEHVYDRAEDGNVVQVAKISPVSIAGRGDLYFALSFGKTPDEALAASIAALTKGTVEIYQEYQRGWLAYLKTLPKVDPRYQAQFNMAAMVLKAHEDKAHPGANIASLSIPWGGGENANKGDVGGYHLVWSRDLYEVATAFMAIGDMAAANRALNFLFDVQQRPDGSFPQNSWLDGRPFWTSLQMDEVAYPLILAYQLGRFDAKTYDHVKRAADFIVANGPATPQERWEEESGYSPSTIAAEIAGLVCAAEIARRNGDAKSADRWLKTADEWEANIEKWTVTKTGKHRDGNYYLRITANGRPDSGDKLELNNGGGTFDEREIVDAGFLELVRLGIRPADDPVIKKSLEVIDDVIRVTTHHGDAFYRYNHDGYGEMDDGRRWNWDGKYTGKGRLWALLSGERGQYEIAECLSRNADTAGRTRCLAAVRRRLDAMLGFANEGMMIPEQVWDQRQTPEARTPFVPKLAFGEGTGSATPLAWSMAQFIRLAVNLKAGRNLETPDVVYRRYAGRRR